MESEKNVKPESDKKSEDEKFKDFIWKLFSFVLDEYGEQSPEYFQFVNLMPFGCICPALNKFEQLRKPQVH